MCLLVHKFKASHILCFLQCALVGSVRGQCDADTVPWPSLPMHTGENHYDNVQYNFSDIVYLAYVYRNLWMPAKFWYQYVRVRHLEKELWILSSRRKNTDTQPHTTWSDDSSLIRVRVEALFLLKRIYIFINLYVCWIFRGVHFLLQLILLLVFVFVNLNVV